MILHLSLALQIHSEISIVFFSSCCEADVNRGGNADQMQMIFALDCEGAFVEIDVATFLQLGLATETPLETEW